MEGIAKNARGLDGADRRRHRRYHQLGVEVKYWVGGKTVGLGARGRIVNISSGGILFNGGAAVAPGKRIQLSVAWPGGLDGKFGLTIRVIGKTVRVNGNYTAVSIQRYEFRARGIGAAEMPARLCA